MEQPQLLEAFRLRKLHHRSRIFSLIPSSRETLLSADIINVIGQVRPCDTDADSDRESCRIIASLKRLDRRPELAVIKPSALPGPITKLATTAELSRKSSYRRTTSIGRLRNPKSRACTRGPRVASSSTSAGYRRRPDFAPAGCELRLCGSRQTRSAEAGWTANALGICDRDYNLLIPPQDECSY